MLERYSDNEAALAIIDAILNTEDSLLISGGAGVGKSTLINAIRKSIKKNYVMLAPTGIAALNVGGSTIHSYFKLKHKAYHKGEETRVVADRIKVMQAIKVLFIDEISMVRADTFQVMDTMLRTYRGIDKPFGGVQVVMIGDMYQLPPVVSKDPHDVEVLSTYSSEYFFGADIPDFDFKIIELTKVYRQIGDLSFTEVLNAVRNGTVTNQQIDTLNTRVDKRLMGAAITLCATNATADEINTQKMQGLKGKQRVYNAELTGDYLNKKNSKQLYERNLPTNTELRLKKGAQVIMVSNDTGGNWANGTIATVDELTDDTIFVNIEGKRIAVTRHSWEDVDYETREFEGRELVEKKVLGSFKQFPLKLGYAITVHKSQGQTISKGYINFGNGRFFAPGQAYVALSRFPSLKVLSLSRPIRSQDIITDPRVVTFMSKAIR